MKACVTSKGQITIPIEIRRKLKLEAGTVLEFDDSADHLRARKKPSLDEMRSVIGCLKEELAGKTTLEWLDELRGAVELPPSTPRRRK